MSLFDVKMTALADAIKAKNTSVTGKLSVDEMTAAVDGIVINPPSGGGADVSGVTATASDVLNTVKFVDNTGTLKSGTIETVTPSVADNTFTVKKGYVSKDTTLSVATAQAPSVNANKVTVYKGYIAQNTEVTIPEATITNDGEKISISVGYNKTAQQFNIGGGGVDLPDGITVQPANVLSGVYYIDANGAKQVGTMPNKGNVTVTLQDSQQNLSAGYYSSIVIPAKQYSDEVIASLDAVRSVVRKGWKFIGFTGGVAVGDMPEHGSVTVTLKETAQSLSAGYYERIDIPAAPPADAVDTSDATATAADILVGATAYAKGVKLTGTLKLDSGGGGTMDFYRCTSYDNGETIPGYTNIRLSGLTSPSDANGTYILQDIESTGTDRVWVSEAGYTIANKNGTWYIYDGAISPNNMTALFYKEVLPSTKGDGSAENPIYWDKALASSSDRTLSGSYLTTDYSSSGNKRNFYVKLLAGTRYQIGVKDGHSIDADIILYDLSGTELTSGDENSAEINGISCSDSVSYTPSATGIYRISAGAYSSGSGTVQVVCYPAPEFAEAPTNTEPWLISWNVGGAAEGSYMITDAGSPAAIGVYTPSTETFDGNTVWTNIHTGAVWKASFSGSSWRWFLYPNAESTNYMYYENNYNNFPSPWDIPLDRWSYGVKPYPACEISTGYGATGTLTISKVDVAERPATGVKVWAGYKATQDSSTHEWTFADTATSGLQVKGATPIVGRIYSADTTVQVLSLTEGGDGKMVCLAHFDTSKADGSAIFVDGTDTCIISTMPQASVTYDRAKFGKGCWGGNYRAVAWNGGFNIMGLPEISGDFTVEFWHYYSAYTDFGGLILYVYETVDYDQQEVASLNAVQLAKTHPQYIEKEWFHHAFVRKGSVVTEYINGIKVATHNFTATLGGSYGLAVYGGGWSQSDVRNNIDEFAIFNYAKYNGKFTPPFVPYDDKPSGLRTPDTEVREVAVSGVKGITWVNSQSYAIIDVAATGTSRRWITADGQWYIHFDDMSGCWAIANGIYPDESGYIQAAYISSGEEQWETEPIGNNNWIDNITGTKVKVTRLSEPADRDDETNPFYPTTRLTLGGNDAVAGTYVYNERALVFPSDLVTITLSGLVCGNYVIHSWVNANQYSTTMRVVHKDDPFVALYTISMDDYYKKGKKWTIATGTEPAPVTM